MHSDADVVIFHTLSKASFGGLKRAHDLPEVGFAWVLLLAKANFLKASSFADFLPHGVAGVSRVVSYSTNIFSIRRWY